MSTIRVAKRERFTVVDRRTVNDDRLSFRARGLLFWLLDKPDDWHTSSDAISRESKEGRDAIRTALRELEECGYLVRVKAQDPDSGHWTTTTLVYEQPPAYVASATEDGFPVVGYPDVGEPVVGESGAKNEDCSPTTDTENPVSPPAMIDPRIAAFDEFWQMYPRKVSKDGAEKAWRAAIKRGAKVSDILDGAQARVEWWRKSRTEMRFIPHASTWLNQSRWQDVLDPLTVNGRTSVSAAYTRVDIVRQEVQDAIAEGRPEMAWQIICERMRATGDMLFGKIAGMLDTHTNATISRVLDCDLRTVDRVREVRRQVFDERRTPEALGA